MSITDIIAQDVESIVITRWTKVPNAGGFSWTPVDLAAQTVRIYNFTTRNQREVTLPEGEVKQIVLGVLAQPNADIIFGHDTRDEFVYNGRTYRIVGVRIYDDVTVDANLQFDCIAV